MAPLFDILLKAFQGTELPVWEMNRIDWVSLFYFKQSFQSKSEFSQQQTWYSGMVTNQEIVTMSQAQKTISDVSTYTVLFFLNDNS